jgi:quercetin dioxygenase-like cupin family protein
MRVIHTKASAADPVVEHTFGGVRAQIILTAPADLEIALVRFDPGARTALHTHTVSQILHCTEGRGILATKTQQNLVEPGDIVHVEAGEEHWHAATADSHFVHLSIRPTGDKPIWTNVDPLK